MGSKKNIKDFIKDFGLFIEKVNGGPEHFIKVRETMFDNIEKRCVYPKDYIIASVVNGPKSDYVWTLVIEEILSSPSGEGRRLVDQFIAEIQGSDYGPGLVSYAKAMRGSEIEVFKINETHKDSTAMTIGVLKNGQQVYELVIYGPMARSAKQGSYWLGRIHKVLGLNFTTLAVLAMEAEEIQFSAISSDVTEFHLWVERIMEDQCKRSKQCRKEAALRQEMSANLVRLVSIQLLAGSDNPVIEETKDILFDCTLGLTSLPIRIAAQDPRNIIKVAQWIRTVESQMKEDKDFKNVSTDWIWHDLALEGLRSESRH